MTLTFEHRPTYVRIQGKWLETTSMTARVRLFGKICVKSWKIEQKRKTTATKTYNTEIS